MTDAITTIPLAHAPLVHASTGVLSDDPGRIRPFDFSRQETIERARLRLLRPLLENVAQRMASKLASKVRQLVHVEVCEDLSQVVWEEHAMTLPDPSFMSVAMVLPPERRLVLHLPVPLGLMLVDFSLGGDGRSQPDRDDLTELEHNLLAPLFAEVWRESIVPALSPITPLNVAATATASSPVLLQLGRPAEMCLVIEMKMTVGESGEHPIALIVPIPVTRFIIEAIERGQSGLNYDQGESDGREVERVLSGVPVDLLVSYPSIHLTPTELVDLRPGDVVPIGPRTDVGYDLLELVVGDAVFATGALIEDGWKLTVSVISTEERKAS